MRGQGAKQTHKLLHEGSLVLFFKEALEKEWQAPSPAVTGVTNYALTIVVGWETTSIMFCWAPVSGTGHKESHQGLEAESLFLSNHQETIETSSQILPSY